MEVDRGEPDDIENADYRIAERVDDELIGIRSLFSEEALKLHMHPEMREVQNEEEDDDHAENEHVLRRPRRRLRLARDGVAHLGGTAGPVFELDKDREKNVDDEAQSEDGHHNLHKNIRVHELARLTVKVGGDDGGKIKREVQSDKDQQEHAAKAHYQLFTD